MEATVSAANQAQCHASKTESWPFTVTRHTSTIGAEIGDVDLRGASASSKCIRPSLTTPIVLNS